MREVEMEMLRFRVCASLARAEWALARLALLPPWAVVRRWVQYKRAKLHLAEAEFDQALLEDALERREHRV